MAPTLIASECFHRDSTVERGLLRTEPLNSIERTHKVAIRQVYGLFYRQEGERYANHILWMAVWRIILTVWDSTRKKIWLGGVVLYRIGARMPLFSISDARRMLVWVSKCRRFGRIVQCSLKRLRRTLWHTPRSIRHRFPPFDGRPAPTRVRQGSPICKIYDPVVYFAYVDFTRS
jgi:hypothetical protein